VTLTLVRHGETEWSRTGRHTGRTDLPLTADGREAATALGDRLRGRAFALVLTSPLRRARDTAALAGFADAVVDDDLAEWDYGDYEGRTTVDIHETRPGWRLFLDGVPNGETIQAVTARAERVIERARAADGDVLAFGHGHLLRVLAARWIEADASFAARLLLDPATLSELTVDRGTSAVLAWNT
jgi:probable phosphoglycerate mutase